jgi:tetratricopeptide (TPR) repeat protein
MPEKKPVSPWLRGTLYVVAILFLPTFLIQLVRPDALDPNAHRPTLLPFRFSFLVQTGAFYERLHWHDFAIAEFQKAEQFAAQLPDADAQYASAQRARYLLAQSYVSAGRPSDAEQTYARIVKAGMDTGDAFRERNQFEQAAPRYQDAERYAQKLTTAKFASVQSARQDLAICLTALNRNTELEQVDLDMVAAMQETPEPDILTIGNTWQSVAFARSHVQNWAGAEQALLQAIDDYDSIIQRFSGQYDPEGRVPQAKTLKNITTWWLAVAYLNEGKMDQARSTAEAAYQIFSQPPITQDIVLQLIAVGLKAATAENDPVQIDLWQQRWNGLAPNAGAGVGEFPGLRVIQMPH